MEQKNISSVFISHPYRGSEARELANLLSCHLRGLGIDSEYAREGMYLEADYGHSPWRCPVKVFLVSKTSSRRSLKILSELRDMAAGTSSSVIVIDTSGFIGEGRSDINEEKAVEIIVRIEYLLRLSQTDISSGELKKQYSLQFDDDWLTKNPITHYRPVRKEPLIGNAMEKREKLKGDGEAENIMIMQSEKDLIKRESSEHFLIKKFKALLPKAARAGKKVDFSVFLDPKTESDFFTIDLWAHYKEEFDYVNQCVKRLGNGKLVAMKNGSALNLGSEITAEIKLDGLDVIESDASLEWNGEATNVSFIVRKPSDALEKDFVGKITITSYGIMIAKITFILKIDNQKTQLLSDETVFPKSAFASYSSKNRVDVLERIQGIKAVAPDLDIFFDLLSLRTGEDWEKALKEHVPSKDVFYLFWSSDAAKSKWVKKEWNLALEKRGLDYITPIPLEGIQQVPPPEKLESLHFGNTYLDYIQLEGKRKLGNL